MMAARRIILFGDTGSRRRTTLAHLPPTILNELLSRSVGHNGLQTCGYLTAALRPCFRKLRLWGLLSGWYAS